MTKSIGFSCVHVIGQEVEKNAKDSETSLSVQRGLVQQPQRVKLQGC